MKQTSKHPTVMLTLSVVSLMIGTVWIAASVTVITSMSAQVEAWRAVILILFSALFVGLGVRGLLRWRAAGKPGNPRNNKIALAILGVVGVMMLTMMATTLPGTWRTGRLNSTLLPLVQEDFSDRHGALPDNPRFVFYNLDTGRFSIPSTRLYPNGTNDPAEVNVVIAYTEGQQKSGSWVSKNTGKKVSDAYSQGVTLYVLRAEDWSLVTKTHFSQQLRYDENGVNVLGMNSVVSYINNLLD